MVQTEIMTKAFVDINLKMVTRGEPSAKLWQLTGLNNTNKFCPPEINDNEPGDLWSLFIFNEKVSNSKIGQFFNKYQ